MVIASRSKWTNHRMVARLIRIFISLFVNLRELFHVLSIISAPIVIGALVAVVFASAPQILEVYRAMVIDALGPAPSEIVDIRIRYGSILALVLLSISLFLSSIILLTRFTSKLVITSQLGRWTVQFGPFLVACLPLCSVALGLRGAIRTAKVIAPDDEIRDRLAFEIAYKAGDHNPDIGFLNSFRKTAQKFFVNVDDGLVLGIVSTIILAAALLYLLSHARHLLMRRSLLGQPKALGASVGLGFVLMISTLIIFVLWPVEVPQALGPITIICMFFIFLQIGFVTTSFLSQKFRFPFTLLLLFWISALAFSGCNDNHELRYLEAQPTQSTLRPSLKECLAVWFATRPDRAAGQRFAIEGAKYPIYIIAAQGGGIYAAHHSATFLAGAQQHAPQFQHHLFAISGISGGSFGSSLFAAALDLRQVTEGRPDLDLGSPCAAPSKKTEPFVPFTSKFNTLNFVDDEVLGRDFLSPLLGAAAFPDFLQRFIPRPIPSFDRARALEYGLQEAWHSASQKEIIDRVDDYSDAVRSRVLKRTNLLESAYSTHWHAGGSTPAMILNTTDVRSGTRRIFSPFEFGDGTVQFFSSELQHSTSLVTAAVLSARFPWITPAGWVRDSQDNSVSRFVDGGYFESSGMVTALQLYDAIQSASRELGILDRISVKILALTFDPDITTTSTRFGGLDEIDDPIQTLLSTWAARGWSNVVDAERRLNNEAGAPVIRVTLNAIRNPLPLGWKISYATRRLILIQRGAPERCIPQPLQSGRGRPFDADCVVAEIIRDIGF